MHKNPTNEKAYVPINIFFLGMVFLILCVISLLVGAKQLHLSDVMSSSSEAWLTLTASRFPRLASLILAGIGLSVCGVILQQIVRNKFVEPATSGGLDAAKLGILMSLIHLPAFGIAGKMIGALVFCLISSVFFITIIRLVRFKNAVLVPVIGLMYGAVLSAVAEFYAYQNNMLQSMQGWLLGDFSRVVQGHYEIIYLILPIVILTYLFAHRFTIVGMGETVATSLGLNYTGLTALGLILVAITVSAVVITVGAIPFVGLIVPNLVAMFYGDNLKRTLPIIALGGASVLLICDIFGRLFLYPFEIPIGLTAGCLGGFMFLVVIWKTKK
ncbi:iron chelate uptake ABC transporter family permease subunit [Marinomonas sp. RSW2]|uniref:Iron chelate uptake ABC transporter family permease subunit n=1 Tax=Marinomonas maritima TaxID=2940935 RepID=A0ABT5WFN1_9GAMM|nr:iron chelate uptake ABC transporter family permease subunit [Marinomonas maritima]MDE8603623.1 iron chelate uptake ABC transporter family permease subunit [Marinomonas maritima]